MNELQHTHVSEMSEMKLLVDRQKLQEMLASTGRRKQSLKSADAFFQKVMSETNTKIDWPNELKVDCKYKRDPFITIAGNINSIQKAKDLILKELNRKQNKVTLKMDVSYKGHSHIIGKGGYNIKRIMKLANCHIHFPDVNKRGKEKSNKVSLSGEPLAVEMARSMIRAIIPLVVTFEVPVTDEVEHICCMCRRTPQIKFIECTYDISVSFLKQTDMLVSVTVRCAQMPFLKHRQGILKLMEYLTNQEKDELPVWIDLELEQRSHEFFQSRYHVIQKISNETDTSITFSNFIDTNNNKLCLKITGTISGAFDAWLSLMKALPLVLIFDLPDNRNIDYLQFFDYMQEKEIRIATRQKRKYKTKIVILTSAEEHSLDLLQLRQKLLYLNKLVFPPFDNSLLSDSVPGRCIEHLNLCLPFSSSISTNSNWSFSSEFCNCSSDNVVYNTYSGNGISSNGLTSDVSVSCEIKNALRSTISSDYEEKRVLAAKAMHRAIESEEQAQIPCSLWAGYGFSKSSPSSLLAQKLEEFNLYGKKEHEVPDSVSSPAIIPNQNNINLDCEKCHSYSDCQGRLLSSEKGVMKFSYSNYFDDVFPKSSLSFDSDKGDLTQLLCSKGLSHFLDIFLQQEIDLEVFSTLTDRDLYDLGFKYTDRRRICVVISELKCHTSKQHKEEKLFDAAPGAERSPTSQYNTRGSENFIVQ